MKHPSTTAHLLFALTAWSAGLAHAASSQSLIERGGYLVRAMACADCHTPMKMGPNGPAPDMARGLSGHPEGMRLPLAPAATGPWLWGGAATNTAFWGPWGVSYAANLTPDAQTGIGGWRAEDFIQTMRTGKHLGVGRQVLPPMPWSSFGQLTDRDLIAVFSYLKAQPPIRNLVPQPTLPTAPIASRLSAQP